jgi:NNP family nitrate/nitrite transporter-like MFS transporter
MTNKMGFVHGLFHSDVNPSNHKSRTLPLFNIKDKYGRTFHLSWIGFFVAFLSWFAFPPLIHGVIEKDLQLTHAQIANSNIMAILATLLVRFIVGPLCDKYGPRYVMIGCLLVGAIPTALVPTINNASELMAIRFFIGILGGTFVPCQVWTSQFFDKNIIGLTNALAAGLGNAGGGVTFFLMPAVVSSLINNHGISQYWAWRLAFPLCPLVIVLCISVITLIFGHDTPTGSWGNRHLKQDIGIVSAQIPDTAKTVNSTDEHIEMTPSSPQTPLMTDTAETQKKPPDAPIATVEDETPRAPTATDIRKTTLSVQTLLVALPYLCSFGSELAVEGIISDLYIQTARIQNSIVWNYQIAGYWAALFGLLNILFRPLGGYISDVLYRYKGITAKKWWVIFLGIMHGIFLIWIGFTKFPIYPLIAAMTGLAIFLEAANGAVFGLVPEIHPKFNGIVSGVTGASGNIGGVLFNLAFRFYGTDYHKALWIIGIFCLGANLAISCIPVRLTKK